MTPSNEGKKIFNLTIEELLKILENPDNSEVDVMAALDNLDSQPILNKPYRPV
jgi:hypothetical protein